MHKLKLNFQGGDKTFSTFEKVCLRSPIMTCKTPFINNFLLNLLGLSKVMLDWTEYVEGEGSS